MEDVSVGGWSVRWRATSEPIPFKRGGRSVIVVGRLSGRDARIAIDADADGPVRVTSQFAENLGLAFRPDVFGREVARGATLEIGALVYPSLSIEEVDSLPDHADAAVGAAFFRETVVELDPTADRVGFHDPARWVSPEGFWRIVIDDDGNRPVATLRKAGQPLRLLLAVASDVPVVLAPEAAARIGLSGTTRAIDGLRWGTLLLPPLRLLVQGSRFDPEWGNDGQIGFDLLFRFHGFVDMPHRWLYLRPLDGHR